MYPVALGFAEDLDTANGQMIVPTLTVYKDCFEAQFLQDTEQYYRVEAATFLVHNSVTDYMKKVPSVGISIHANVRS